MNLIYKILIFLCLFYPITLLVYYGYNDSKSYYKISPSWSHDIERNYLLRNRNLKSQPTFERNYFYNKKILLYYNRQGEALHKILLDSQTLISPDSDYYVVYPRTGQKIDLFNNQGEKQWSLDTYAIPFITPFRKNIILLSSDHNTLTAYDYNRNLILPPTYLDGLITDYAICEDDDSLIIGTIGGNAYHFNHQMKQTFKKSFQQSRFNYIKSVNCSKTGNYFLTLSGLYPEQLSLINRQGKILWSQNTDQDRRTKTDMFIDENNDIVLDVQKKYIRIFSLNQGKVIKDLLLPPEQGPIKRVVFNSLPGWTFLGINNEKGYQTLLLNSNLEIVWKNFLIDEYLTYIEIQKVEDTFFLMFHSISSIYSYLLLLK